VARHDDYRAHLRGLTDWDAYLLAESGLPGPRANLDLVQAVADEGAEDRFRTWLAAADPIAAPANTPGEFLALCGAVGLGRLLAAGRADLLSPLRYLANDPRWRVREGVAMALQRLGDADMPALLRAMEDWAGGSPLERRAAVAALCEPRLLRDPAHARAALVIVDRITASLLGEDDRRGPPFLALRQALGYGWSVVVVALGAEGQRAFERWCAVDDRDIRWLVRQNLTKDRLQRLDAAWVARLAAQTAR
jgi:hypothetical protein